MCDSALSPWFSPPLEGAHAKEGRRCPCQTCKCLQGKPADCDMWLACLLAISLSPSPTVSSTALCTVGTVNAVHQFVCATCPDARPRRTISLDLVLVLLCFVHWLVGWVVGWVVLTEDSLYTALLLERLQWANRYERTIVLLWQTQKEGNLTGDISRHKMQGCENSQPTETFLTKLWRQKVQTRH